MVYDATNSAKAIWGFEEIDANRIVLVSPAGRPDPDTIVRS